MHYLCLPLVRGGWEGMSQSWVDVMGDIITSQVKVDYKWQVQTQQ